MGQDLVIAAYFTSKNDPQRRGKRYKPDQWSLVDSWYRGLYKFGLRGVVLHDGCSNEWCEKHTDDYIAFQKVELGPYTTNVDRFYHYLQLMIDALYTNMTSEDYVLCTDLFDITFNADPFKFMKSRKEKLFFGEFKQFSPNLRDQWHRQAYRTADLYRNKPYLAATAFGGKFKEVYPFICDMLEDFNEINPKHNVDMAVIHHTAWLSYSDCLFYGSPFTGDLKTGKYGHNDCIIHLREHREDPGAKR